MAKKKTSVSGTKKVMKKTGGKGIFSTPNYISELLQVVDGHFWYETTCCSNLNNGPHTSIFITTSEIAPAPPYPTCKHQTIPTYNVEMNGNAKFSGALKKTYTHDFKGYFDIVSNHSSSVIAPILAEFTVIIDYKGPAGKLKGKTLRLKLIESSITTYWVASEVVLPIGKVPDFRGEVSARQKSKKKGGPSNSPEERLHVINLDCFKDAFPLPIISMTDVFVHGS